MCNFSHPFSPGKSCWQSWSKGLIHPSSFLSTRRRAVMFWPQLRRWGVCLAGEGNASASLVLLSEASRAPWAFYNADPF